MINQAPFCLIIICNQFLHRSLQSYCNAVFVKTQSARNPLEIRGFRARISLMIVSAPSCGARSFVILLSLAKLRPRRNKHLAASATGGARCLFPLFFRVLLWLIYALNYILKGNFVTDFPPIILFLTNFVAEKVAKSPVEWCRVVMGCQSGMTLYFIVFALNQQ